MLQKILIACGWLGNWGETNGIVNTYHNLLPYFAKNGIETDVLVYGTADKIEKEGSVTIFTHKPRMPIKIDPNLYYDLMFPFSKTAKIIKQKRYDLVQISIPDPMGLFVLKLANQQKCPTIMIYHTAYDLYSKIRVTQRMGSLAGKICGKITRSWLCWFHNQSDLTLTLPGFNIDEALGSKFRSKTRELSRGVNCELFHPRKRTRTDSRVKALYVGRVAPEKNLSLLINLFQNRSDVDLVVVGHGPYLEEMKNKLPNAEFLGKLSGEQLVEAYANGDFFVFPSHTDTLGCCVMEAMSCALPVIVTNSMGPKELVDDGKTGFVASSDAEFSLAVDKLVQNTALRQQMGQAALVSDKIHSWQKIFDQLLHYYEMVIREAKSFNGS